MNKIWKGLLVLTLSYYVVASRDSSGDGLFSYTVDDEFDLMEPIIVAEPENGSPWWYTPSRRAHIFKHRYQSALNKLNHRAGQRQGEDMRLPGDLIPIRYNVEVFPFVELISSGNYTTDGYVEIVIECIRNTRNISLNSADLTIKTETIAVSNLGTNNPLALVNFIDEQNDREIITIQTASELVAGQQYKISMRYLSTLNNELRGFYRSSYVEEGVTKWLAVTQFESTDARRAFPCFDEPAMKANFTVSIGRKESMTSVSNMRQIRTDPMVGMPGYVWDRFDESVKMSSYLVAFLVSEFTNIPANPGVSNVQFRIWARPNAMNLTSYAIDIGPKILEFYESYFGIDYPLSKQDMAAIPDFSAGAMENWGLITYRESDLLIDPDTASARQKQRVAIVSAHELAHQWFGDLVTMEWWNAIWLNEGFASYMEFIGTDSVEPTFRMDDQFVVENLQYVFGIDGLETSRPINLEVNTPSEISALFDAISYEKGSCIIRMCADFLGLETFKRGLTRYLSNNAYGNAQQDDLWQALEEQANIDKVVLPATVKQIMDTWTYKMGYPVVKVVRNYEAGSASVSQERFLLRESGSSGTDPTVYQWWVPLTHTNAKMNVNERNIEWLSEDETTKEIENLGASETDWILFNFDQQNYYRVAYDANNFVLLTNQLLADHQRIKTNNRAQLLDDAFVLASVNMVEYQLALNLSVYLKQETEYVPWNAVLGELNYIDTMLHNVQQFQDWKNHMISLITPYYNYVGFEEKETDSQLTIYSRSDAMSWACRLGIKDCVDKAVAKYADQMSDPDNSLILSPNQKSIILRTGIENGHAAEWDFAFNQYVSKQDRAFLVAATCSKESTRLYDLLEMMLKDDSGIPLNDVNTLFSNVAANPLGNAIATNFLINRWDDIQNSRLGSRYFESFFRYLCNRQNTQEELDRLLKLRQDHFDILGSSNTVQQGLDVVLENIKWMDLHQEEIGYWLIDPSALPPTTTTMSSSSESNTSSEPSPTTPSTVSTTQSVASTTPSAGNRLVQLDSILFVGVIVLLGLKKF